LREGGVRVNRDGTVLKGIDTQHGRRNVYIYIYIDIDR